MLHLSVSVSVSVSLQLAYKARCEVPEVVTLLFSFFK